VLIVIKIALDRSNAWLVMSNMAVLSVTLWGVAWADIQSFIATYNVRHSYEVTGQGVPIDHFYMSELGPAAIPAIDEFLVSSRFADQPTLTTFSLLRNELTARVVVQDWNGGTAHRMPETWHGWTWREDRLESYLIEHPFAPAAATAID
jgi:hypothetical protein